MYLVIFPIDSGEDLYLFFHADPRKDGCLHSVQQDVALEELSIQPDELTIDAKPGERGPHVLGRSQRVPTKYRVFRSEFEAPMDWDILPNPFEVWATWEAWEQSIQ